MWTLRLCGHVDSDSVGMWTLRLCGHVDSVGMLTLRLCGHVDFENGSAKDLGTTFVIFCTANPRRIVMPYVYIHPCRWQRKRLQCPTLNQLHFFASSVNSIFLSVDWENTDHRRQKYLFMCFSGGFFLRGSRWPK